MKISRHDYELVAPHRLWRRSGALIRVESEAGIGYADVHPWPEYGDEPLQIQLVKLAEGVTTPLTAQSLECAGIDAEARAEEKWLFEGLAIPASHRSLVGITPATLEQTKALGFTVVKLKGTDMDAADAALLRKSGLRVRLDFNAALSFDGVVSRLKMWGDWRFVDLIEDPCPYDSEQWARLRGEFGLSLGADWEFRPGSNEFDVRVMKPARQRLGDMDPAVPLMVTSSFDHPIGQVYAAYVAAQAPLKGYQMELCGLVTHAAYPDNEFAKALGPEAPVLSPPQGPGLGFGELLEKLDWRPL